MSLHSSPPGETDRQRARLILQTVLMSQLSTEKQQWLSDQLALVAIEKSNRSVDLAFGLCPRRLGKKPLLFTTIEKNDLNQCMPGWDLDGVSMDAVARMLVLTCFSDTRQLAEQLTRLLRHADLHEQLALYKGLPLYAASATVNDRLADGLRSNISEVFEAIAHNNPYAGWHLDTHRFNHMVLKALFIESTLAPIVHLEERNNLDLVRMLLDFARERRAALRSVPEELWSLTVPLMTHDERLEFNQEQAA
ncbi:MAG: EboA domain-containing protein [Granulosicoccus sp.]